jgi:D-glycero-D-manno-heptose 1,7-bisphosphate phosphatase
MKKQKGILVKVLFLDRDGVINKEKNYVHKIEDFEFIDGVFEGCKNALENGYQIIVITNQAGIARGYYTEEDFQILTHWMIDEFKKRDIDILDVFYCPHHPDFTGECECRKPKPGMILEAAKKYSIDLKNSILVGDKNSDIEAGKRAGINNLYLIDTGHKIEKNLWNIPILNSLQELPL